MGIHIVSYLDDWLILAQSEVELLSHRSLLLRHLACLGLRVNSAKNVSQPFDIVPVNSFRLGPNEGYGHGRAYSGHTAARGLFRDRSLSLAQIISENAGSHGLCVPSAKAAPASNAAPAALAETQGSIRCLVSRTPANQGEPSLCDCPGPLEMSLVDGTGHALGNGLQKESGLDRCFQHGLGSSVQRPTGLPPVVERGKKYPHQLPGNANSMSSPSCLFTRPEVAPHSGPLGQHDRGGLHKSPRRALLEAPLHFNGTPLGMGTARPAFAQSNACARTEPGCRHAVTEQCLLRKVDSPSANGPGNMGDLWKGRGRPLCLKRQLSLPDILFEEHECVGPRLAQPPPLCVSPNCSDPSGHQVNQETQTQSYFSGPALKEPVLVLKAVSAAHRSPLAHSSEMGPPLSGEQNNVAPPGRALGSAPLASQWELADLPFFFKGSRRLNPPRPFTIRTWGLPTFLRALKGPPFEPLQSVSLQPLLLKTVLLLVLASVKQMCFTGALCEPYLPSTWA